MRIVNREHQPASYEAEITINGDKVGEVGPISLNHEEKREQQVSFASTRAGPDQKVERRELGALSQPIPLGRH